MHARFMKAGFIAATVVLAACGGDGTGNNGSELNDEERQALATALAANGGLGGSAAAFAPIAFAQISEFGTMTTTEAAAAAVQVAGAIQASMNRADEFSAAGVQVKFDVTMNGETTSGVITGVFGWNGLNTQTNTVDEVLSAYAITDGELPSTISADLATEEGFGTYYNRSSSSTYVASEGELNVTSSSFGGGDDCSTSSQGVEIECSYSLGTMEGNLHFDANKVTGGGESSYTQGETTFDLPAVRIEMSMDMSDFTTATARK